MLFLKWMLVAVHGNWRGRVRTVAQRRHPGEGGGLHAGKRTETINQFVLKRFGSRHIVSRCDQRHTRRYHARGGKARACSSNLFQTFEQQGRSTSKMKLKQTWNTTRP